MSKKVTWIVPVYNSEDTLERCLNSLCVQNYANMEILLIDNNSTDNSKLVCEQYADKDSRIRVLSEQKQGAGAARNRGLAEGTGDILCFADADDELLGTEVVTEVVAAMENADLGWFDYEDAVPNRKRGRALFLHNNDSMEITDTLVQVEGNDLHSVLAVLWNKAFDYHIIREKDIRFPEDRTQGEDFSFVLQYLKEISKVQFIHKVFYKKHEPHLTMSQVNAYNTIPLIRNYMEDTEKYFGHTKGCEQVYMNLARHLSSDAIIAVIRMHHPDAEISKQECMNAIGEMLQNKAFRQAFRYYHPGKGQSKLLPFCMKIAWKGAVYRLGKRRAHKAYNAG